MIKMADPLSALGAAAAALQIASQAFELIKYLSGLYNKIKDAPELMQTRISHLEQLIEISNLIVKTRPLQTAEVQKVLVACIRMIMKLRALLEKHPLEDQGKMKKIVNAFRIANKEDDIAMLLTAIEREKSLLALSIHQIDAYVHCNLYGIEDCLQLSSAQLQTININITELQTIIDNASLVITDTAHHVQTMVEILPDIGDQVHGLYQEVPRLADGIEAIQEQLRVSQCKCLKTAGIRTAKNLRSQVSRE